MLPIYKAIAIGKRAIATGSTRPCILTVADSQNEIIGDYVVKVFKSNNIQQNHSTHKEVFGNVLAKGFDLKVPNAALVKVNQDIVDQLNRNLGYSDFDLMAGVYFGSEYLDSSLDYSPSFNPKLEDWEIETIFAFDALIQNIDRREKKPNLFFHDSQVYLIDHELSLTFGGKTFAEMYQNRNLQWSFLDQPDRKHLFLEKLRAKNKKNKVTFDDFQEYLQNLDINILDGYASQLDSFDNENTLIVEIKSYLEEIKSNPQLFHQILLELIQ